MGRCGTHRKRANHRSLRRCAVQCPRVPRQEGTRLAPPGSVQPWPSTLASDLRASTHCQNQPWEGRDPPTELRELNQISNSNLESTAALMDHRHYHHRCRARPPNRALIERRTILSIISLISTPHSLYYTIVLRCVLCTMPVSLCGSTLCIPAPAGPVQQTRMQATCRLPVFPPASCLPAARGPWRLSSDFEKLAAAALETGEECASSSLPLPGTCHLASDCPFSSLTRPSKTPARV